MSAECLKSKFAYHQLEWSTPLVNVALFGLEQCAAPIPKDVLTPLESDIVLQNHQIMFPLKYFTFQQNKM